jgi:23S rRNA (uracil1939-C5)-methyltransferase
VARANEDGEVLATVVTARAAWLEGPAFARALRQARPEVVGVVQNVNPTTGNVLFGAEDRPLDGAEALTDRLGGVRVTLGPRAFFQVNRGIAALAYEAIAARAAQVGGRARAVDAYAGVGGIALRLAPLFDEVLAVEENPAATARALDEARRAGIVNVEAVTADAAAGLASVPAADLVVLNPPRAGCAPATLDEVARLRPAAVAYLSCNPATLTRDLTALTARGFVVEAATPFDMHPHTPHVEVLATLRAGG